MRIVFFDLSGLDYTTETPRDRPLGGSQSAICYLAEELALRGHRPAIVNSTTRRGIYRGVEVVNLDTGGQPGFLRQADAIVVLNAPRGLVFRRQIGITAPLIAWLTHAPDQRDVQGLGAAEERAAWSGFAFVSQWQADAYAAALGVSPGASRVMRNAMAPAFRQTTNAVPWFRRQEPPVLVYTSMPFRGLDVLLDAFPTMRAAIPGIRLRIFSNMAPYQVDAARDPYQPLYSRAGGIVGVEYIGAVGQDRLAGELAGAAALAYPSTFAETSCIVAIEALASGAAVVTTRLGALPETLGDFGHFVSSETDHALLAAEFATKTVELLTDRRDRPDAAMERRDAQMAFARAAYDWRDRAGEWEAWIRELTAVSQAEKN